MPDATPATRRYNPALSQTINALDPPPPLSNENEMAISCST